MGFMNQTNGIKELLFGIFLMLLALWSLFMARDGGMLFLIPISFLSSIVGVIYAIKGLQKKDI